MATLAELIADVRSALNESSARFWTDAELTQWINDGLKDVARRAQVLQEYSATIAGVIGQSKYALPSNLLTLHRVEYNPPASTQVYPVQLMTLDQISQYWGLQQDTQSSYPFAAYEWGTPGVGTGLQLGIYPTLSEAGGVLRIWYYRLPAVLVNVGDVAEIPSGWESLIVDYCEYRAKRKARDQTWVEAKQLYDEALQYMIDSTRQWHDSNDAILFGGNVLPGWLTGASDYW